MQGAVIERKELVVYEEDESQEDKEPHMETPRSDLQQHQQEVQQSVEKDKVGSHDQHIGKAPIYWVEDMEIDPHVPVDQID